MRMWLFSGDHALIDINKLLSLNPKQVTVRTKSRDNQSSDSVPTPIPANILKGKQHSNKVEVNSLNYLLLQQDICFNARNAFLCVFSTVFCGWKVKYCCTIFSYYVLTGY